MCIRKEVLHEVELIKYEGGEIPEVAFWNSFFYLTNPPPKGLGLTLTEKELNLLKKSVIERYLKIIERDLTPENIEKPFYRGIERVIINIKRLKNFTKKEGLREEFKESLKKIENWVKNFKAKTRGFQKEKLEELENILRSLL